MTGPKQTGGPGIDLTITQSATAITVEYRAGGQAPAPVTLTYKLDGSASKNVETSAPARGGGVTNVSKVTYKRYERATVASFDLLPLF